MIFFHHFPFKIEWHLKYLLINGFYNKVYSEEDTLKSQRNFSILFRFMALSKLFLIGDKRIDNLLVIGFNPSHTNVSNDVTAPLKILATLIRCLDN